MKPSKVSMPNTEVLVRQATPFELLGNGNSLPMLTTALGLEVTSDQPHELEELSSALLDEAQDEECLPTFRFALNPSGNVSTIMREEGTTASSTLETTRISLRMKTLPNF
jgi:hypothetical protein